jgi:biopolymer transport protein TolQ
MTAARDPREPSFLYPGKRERRGSFPGDDGGIMTSILVPYFPLADIGFAFRQSNLAGQVIVVVLFVGSIFAWSVMLTKWRQLELAKRKTGAFLSAYRKDGHPVALFVRRQRFPESPVYMIYEKACNALGAMFESRGADPEDLFMGAVGSREHRLTDVRVRSVRNICERTMADQALMLEHSMGFLATVVPTAPFLGLLGTVWGVMDSFGGMVVKGSAMLSEVAPGISGALLTTVVGLLVALPSAIGYNMLTDRIRRLNVDMDNFIQEFMSDLEGHYVEEPGA